VPHSPDRYPALDGLRGFAMFLGIVLHVGISFMDRPPAFWPVRDTEPTPLADVLLVAVHDFRMQLFFLLSGFFSCLLYQRYGLKGLTIHRLKRVGVPFALALLFIVPSTVAVGLYAEIENGRAGTVRGAPSPLRPVAADVVAANPDAPTAQLVADYYLSGAGFAHFPLLHLWFLYYLLIFFGAVIVLAPVLGRLTGTRLLAHADAAFRWVVQGRWRVPVPALLTFPLMLPMNWIADTPWGWLPQWHIVAYYFAFFAFGWMHFRHRDLVPCFGRGWILNLVLANLVVLPAMLVVIGTGVDAERDGADATVYRLGGFAVSVVYTWLMITGLWGAFLRLFAHASVWGRYMADASYWCYLASLTPIVLFQFVVRNWDAPGLLKAVVVTGATMAVLLASYEWCVRYTVIGALLNGRKYRTLSAEPQPSQEQRPRMTGSTAG
jgi:glucans biosynthesis protein C